MVVIITTGKNRYITLSAVYTHLVNTVLIYAVHIGSLLIIIPTGPTCGCVDRSDSDEEEDGGEGRRHYGQGHEGNDLEFISVSNIFFSK